LHLPDSGSLALLHNHMSAVIASPPPPPPAVAAVLSASGHARPHPLKPGLSRAQIVRHGRGAETLRSTLFAATIPVNFTALCTPPATVAGARVSRPCAPILVRPDTGDGGSFVFARAPRGTPLSLRLDKSAGLLDAFLPLAMPSHLTPSAPPSPAFTTRALPSAPSAPSANAWTIVGSPPPLSPCFEPIRHPARDGRTCYFDPVYRPPESARQTRLPTQLRTVHDCEDIEEEDEADSVLDARGS
jgi:hypothetical protein